MTVTLTLTQLQAEGLAILAGEGCVLLDAARNLQHGPLPTAQRRHAARAGLRRLRAELNTPEEIAP